ncbi:hypothetical protein ABZP36_007986 [Zizania latifolia]
MIHITFLEINSIGCPSPSFTSSSPLDPSIPQPSTMKTTVLLRSVTTKPPPFTTTGLLLIISVVGVLEQKILLTTGMPLSISLETAHEIREIALLPDLYSCFCVILLQACSMASRPVLILSLRDTKAVVLKAVTQA